MNNHIIRRFEIELQVPDQQQGITIQDEVLRDRKDEIIRSVSAVLDEFVGPDEFLTIDRLVIDAGRFTVSNFSETFATQFKTVLASQLERLVQQAREEAGREVVLYDTDEQGNSIEIAVHLKSRIYSTQEIIWHLLVSGLLPWRSAVKQSLQELVSQLAGKEAMTQLLRELAVQKQYNGFLRLALQLKEEFFLQLFTDSGLRHFVKLLGSYLRSEGSAYAAAEFAATVLFVKSREPEISPAGVLYILRREIETIPAPSYSKPFARLLEIAAAHGFSENEITAAAAKENGVSPAQLSAAQWQELIQLIRQTDAELQAKRPDAQQTDEPYKPVKPETETPLIPDEDGYVIENAGLVLLYPFISTFLARTGHIENKKFVSEQAQAEAAVLLQLLVWGNPEEINLSEQEEEAPHPFDEHQLLLNKILVGLSPETPLPAWHQFEHSRFMEFVAEADKAVQHAIQTWELLKRSTVPSFRKMFLQHKGRLQPGHDGWELLIERDSFDVLIDKVPWPISIIRYPWSEKVIYVTW
ncbi:MAG: contractile injection system tape measure protein [Bacteroidia bacterium]|jgi:hypothetical protein|nr:contractile injection system tape measure protein [Bacteroidia bacterium]